MHTHVYVHAYTQTLNKPSLPPPLPDLPRLIKKTTLAIKIKTIRPLHALPLHRVRITLICSVLVMLACNVRAQAQTATRSTLTALLVIHPAE